jgi:adenosine deaminase
VDGALDEAASWIERAPLSHAPPALVEWFTRQSPKIDLHFHLEGAIRPEQALAVARRHGITLPAETPEELRRLIQMHDGERSLLAFLAKFEPLRALFLNRQAIADLTDEVLRHGAADNLRYLEVRFSPLYMAQAYQLDLEEVMAGVLQGVRQGSRRYLLTVRLIMVVERQMGLAPAEVVRQLALKYCPQGVVALDLANDELHYPPGPYAALFRRAKKAGLSITVHAGEAAGAENVKVSVEQLQADRIGHGVRAQEDPNVVALLRDRAIPLELCPTSNVQTGAVESLATHPLPNFLRQGVPVTINTDDPGISGITLSSELALAARRFGLTLHDLEQVTQNAATVAFLSPREKSLLQARIRRGFAAAKRMFLNALTPQEAENLLVAALDESHLPPEARQRIVTQFRTAQNRTRASRGWQ